MKSKTRHCVYKYKDEDFGFYYVVTEDEYINHLRYQDLKLVKIFVKHNEAKKLADALNTL